MAGHQPAVVKQEKCDCPGYTQLQFLQSGGFGAAYKERDNATGEVVAIKYILRASRGTATLGRELINHRNMRHPHVIPFKKAILTDRFLAVVMEYADGGEVFGQVCDLGRLTEPEARCIFQQVTSAVAYMHSMQVAHRDLKLENVLFMRKWKRSEQPLCKICDFGFSKWQPAEGLTTILGTQAYAPPEIVNSAGRYDGKKVDSWAAGVLLYTMLVGAYPFGDPNADTPGMLKNISRVNFYMPPALSQDCQDLLRRIFVQDPAHRASIDDFRAHPWFRAHLPAYLEPGRNEVPIPEPHGLQSAQELDRLATLSQQMPAPAAHSAHGHPGYVPPPGVQSLLQTAMNAAAAHKAQGVSKPGAGGAARTGQNVAGAGPAVAPPVGMADDIDDGPAIDADDLDYQ